MSKCKAYCLDLICPEIFNLSNNEIIGYTQLKQAVRLMEDASQSVFDSLSEIAHDARREHDLISEG